MLIASPSPRMVLPLRCMVMVVTTHLALAAAAAANVDVSAFFDRTRVAVGESAVLSIRVTGTQDTAPPQVSGLDDIRVQYIGPATEMRIENGRMTSSVTYRYSLFPQREGRFTVGPLAVQVDGEVRQTQPLVLHVTARGRAATGDGPGLRLEARVERDQPFVGERLPLTIRLLIPQEVSVDDLQFPTVQGDGLTVGSLPQPVQHDEILDGRRYRVLYFETHLTPVRPTEVELRVAMALNILEQRRGQRGLFGGMMGGAFAERRPLELQADPVPLRVRPLPPAGRPAGFTGAVGNFDLQVSASPTNLTAGDPISLRVEIAGDGDLSRAQPPRLSEIDGFRVYDPVAIKDAGEGRRGHEQVVIPQSPQITRLPALSFSYFDPRQEEYRTVHRGPIELQVTAAADAGPGVVANGEGGRRERDPGPIGRDIVYVKGAPGTWRDVGSRWFGSWWFWASNAVPILAFGLLSWRARERDLLASNPKLRRYRAAAATLRRELDVLEGPNDPAQFFDALSRAMAAYFAAKLDLPPGAVDAGRVRRALEQAGFAAAILGDSEKLFADLESHRYAPGLAAEVDRRDLTARARRIVDSIEERRDIGERLMKALSLLLAAPVLLCCALAAPSHALAGAGSDSETDTAFFAGNHAYADERYGDALASYEEVSAAGRESGALHFNSGNAHFKRGDAASAVASYLRAARLLPRDPDVAANLAFAEEHLDLEPTDEALWRRVSFFLAHRLSEAELALAFSAAWWAMWATLCAGIVAPHWRESQIVPVRIIGVLAIVLMVNLAYRNERLELHAVAVVTAAAGAAVRFEPDESGTEHFAAPAGSRLRVDESRDGWILVARDDGRRGWVRADAVTPMW